MNHSENNNTKKRKLDQNDVVSPDAIRKVLAPLTPQQLSEIIVTASFLHPDVFRVVRALVDNDVTQRHLFVHSLGPKTTSDSLRSVFAAFGELEEVEVAVYENGKTRGSGYVTFRNAGSAMLALQEPVKVVDGRMTVCALNVNRRRGAGAGNGGNGNMSRVVFVSDVPDGMSAEVLLRHFKGYGQIKRGPVRKRNGLVVFMYRRAKGATAALVKCVKKIDGYLLTCTRGNGDDDDDDVEEDSDGGEGVVKVNGVKETDGCRVYIGNLPKDMTKERLLEHFKEYGEVKTGPYPTDKDTGKFTKNFCFIVYENVEGANACLADSKKSINGSQLYCSRANRDNPTEVAGELVKKICIYNVPPNMSKVTLWDHFSKYGEVKRGPFGTDKDTGKFLKGHAFIIFKDVESADACLVDPKKIVDGRQLYCERQTDKKVKEGKMVAPVQVQGSDDGVRKDELNSTHPNLTQGSCGSHLDSGGPSGVSGGLGITGEPSGISGYGGGCQGSPLRHSDHLLNAGGSHLGERGEIYGGMGRDPDASYYRTTGDREVQLGVSYGGHGSYDRTISDGEAWLRDRYAGRGASYDRTRSDGEALLHNRYGGLGASYDRTTGDGEALLRDRYGGRGTGYDRTIGDGEAALLGRYGGHAAIYDRTIDDGEAGLLGRYGGHYDRTTGDGDMLLGDRYGDRGGSYGGMGSTSYVMSPRSLRGISGGYPESAHYSLSSGSADQTQQQNKRSCKQTPSPLSLLRHRSTDEDFVLEKDDSGSPTDIYSEGEDSDASDSGGEKEISVKKETKKEPTTSKASSSKKRKPKKKKDPNAPKRAMSGLMFFSQLERKNVKEDNPGIAFTDIGRVLRERWSKLSAGEKEPYEAKAKADKKRYKDEINSYKPQTTNHKCGEHI